MPAAGRQRECEAEGFGNLGVLVPQDGEAELLLGGHVAHALGQLGRDHDQGGPQGHDVGIGVLQSIQLMLTVGSP